MSNPPENLTIIQKRWQICINCMEYGKFRIDKPLQERDANAPWNNYVTFSGDCSTYGLLCGNCPYVMEHTVLAGGIRERWLKYYEAWLALCGSCENDSVKLAKLSLLAMLMKYRLDEEPIQELQRCCRGCKQKKKVQEINKEFEDVLPRPRAE